MQTYNMLINGKWVNAESGRTFSVLNPATEEEIARVALGDKADVDKAVEARARLFQLGPKRPRKREPKF